MSEFKETAIISLDILYEREMFADIGKCVYEIC